jgi:arylformamidase
MKNNICLSHIIRQNTQAYGNRDRIFIRTNSSIKKGESANSSCWIFSNNHIGTHIDTPNHFSELGRKTYEIPINDFIFDKVQLVDIPCNDARLIDIEDFNGFNQLIGKNTELLLIRTGYEKFREEDKYWNDNPGLAPELADYFRTNYPDLRCIGFDFISLTSWKFREEGKKSHQAFLCPEFWEKEILVIEDMALANIFSPMKQVIVAPLFVEDGNGGAVTIFANIVS